MQLDEITSSAPAEEKLKVKVVQNYTSIRVIPDFKEDDIQPLQPTSEGINAVNDDDEEDIDSDEEEEETTEDKSNGGLAPNDMGLDENGEENRLSATEGSPIQDSDDDNDDDDNDDDVEAMPQQKKKVKSVSFLPLDPPAQDGDGDEKQTKKKRRRRKEKSTSVSSSAFFAPTLMKLEKIKRDAKRNQRQLDLIRAKLQKRKDAKMGKTSLSAKQHQPSHPAVSKVPPAQPDDRTGILPAGTNQTTGTQGLAPSRKVQTAGTDNLSPSGKVQTAGTKAVLPSQTLERKDVEGVLSAATMETTGAEGQGVRKGHVVPSASGKWRVSAHQGTSLQERGIQHTGTVFLCFMLGSVNPVKKHSDHRY